MIEMDNENRETNTILSPKFDDKGLLTAVISDVSDGYILMVGHMNEEALLKTIETDIVHFYSRSRQKLWQKGETSGNILEVSEIRLDCDQDALWIIAKPTGPTCHTGVRSCFYRRVTKKGLEAL